ncbi:alpha-1,3-mannosyl-glycoprotein 4-beta-N-acetylglucosaminyltransferase B isoform X2 [Scleropages formosus]|uniref:alpha-1,3-mannosyl-glycoprotein 4-beta-N-acetylglucosaminyltransferase B isoform X2 n=1 Tax=Scleropages formosus TaxID=113540 RepID=UPI000878F722|nr:alpha-1,3-mannosyl-glycoprotein 4-beta-N-acetylglucosaminyltransferase B-like isoform X2 [Scleropages formosus]
MRFICGRIVLFLSLSLTFSVFWHTFHNQKDTREKSTETQLMAFYEELFAAEERGIQLSRELRTVLDRLEHLTKEQTSSTTNQTVSLVLGIPTVKREKQSYLISTLSSLFYELSPEELTDIVVIVFVAEVDSAYVQGVAESIMTKFPDEVNSGILEVVTASPHFYPSFSQLKETLGDSKERVKWRTKQNLDYSFLMLYAQQKGSYYVQLEDDIAAKEGYLQAMKTFAKQNPEDWLILEFSQLGFIGKMFRTSDLPMLVEFILMFYKDKPIDWLLDHILWVKVCHPEKGEKDCSRKKDVLRRRYKPSLFQHIGIHSSLKGKIQKLKDRDFGKQTLFKAHTNPPAELKTSLTAYESHTLERAYLGQDFFWGMSPVIGDFVQISFHQPQPVKGYLFRSGNIETNGDKLYNTTVEVLPSDSSVLWKIDKHPSTDGFIVIGAFVNGVAEGTIDPLMEKISAIRLVIHSDSDVWALLSEIFIRL